MIFTSGASGIMAKSFGRAKRLTSRSRFTIIRERGFPSPRSGGLRESQVLDQREQPRSPLIGLQGQISNKLLRAEVPLVHQALRQRMQAQLQTPVRLRSERITQSMAAMVPQRMPQTAMGCRRIKTAMWSTLQMAGPMTLDCHLSSNGSFVGYGRYTSGRLSGKTFRMLATLTRQ